MLGNLFTFGGFYAASASAQELRVCSSLANSVPSLSARAESTLPAPSAFCEANHLLTYQPLRPTHLGPPEPTRWPSLASLLLCPPS